MEHVRYSGDYTWNPKPLGRGVWVLDASDTNNFTPRLHIKLRDPRPAAQCEVRVFGPFLVVRSRQPTRTIREFLLQTLAVPLAGPALLLGASDISLLTVERTLGLRGLDARGARASHERRYLPSRLKAYSLLLLVPPSPRA
jgi:hypothetical protein